jgi:agmatinase
MKEIGLENAVKRISRKTGKAIYVSFNYDLMRLSDMPSVRTPEPGGLSYGKTVDMLAQIMVSKSVVGMDFVGLAPIQGLQAPNVVAAKLIQKTLCNAFKELVQ